MIHSTEEWAEILFVPLYQEKFLQTLWNTPDPYFQKNGWILKSGKRSPWFFNMRPLGDSPELFFNCCVAMADLISQCEDVDIITAVEMAGVNFSGGMAVASKQLLGIPCRIAYTRPLERKLRTPADAVNCLTKSIEACLILLIMGIRIFLKADFARATGLPFLMTWLRIWAVKSSLV